MATVNFELYSDDLYLPSVERGGGEREREMAEGYDEGILMLHRFFWLIFFNFRSEL